MSKEIETGFYGLGSSLADAQVIYLPVPWDATTSYRAGTSLGPAAMFEASYQLDFFDSEILNPHEQGMAMLDIPKDMIRWNTVSRHAAQKVMSIIKKTGSNKKAKKELEFVNLHSAKVNDWVRKQSLQVMQNQKVLGLIGGDHASPLGAFHAAAQSFGQFGILHFDAHLDLRDAYQGFQYSHASIMRNAVEEIPNITSLVQVGIRDYSAEEWQFAMDHKKRVHVYLDQKIQNQKMEGIHWQIQCESMIQKLPNQVWISFDIDGLDPRYCPSTGTPVPGGLDFYEATYLIGQIAKSGRKIIGFDLCEVSPPATSQKRAKNGALQFKSDPQNEWDANVGMRMLYKLSAWALYSQKLVKLRD